MRVLLTGATGLIGSAVLARLLSEGHEIVAIARPGRAGAARDGVIWVALDIARAIDASDWQPHLDGVAAIVNCAGVFQNGPGDSTAGVHLHGMTALYTAAARAGVHRLIQVSALGAAADAPTAFARTKAAGDAAAMASGLDWVILRPSVVLGRAAYGGSALIRGLAALPVRLDIAGTGPLQVVQLDDLVAAILFFLKPDAPTRIALDVAGPERLAFADVVAAYRRWLGLPPARACTLPRALAAIGFRLGDLAGLLGWRSPVRTTARREIARGSIGDPSRWIELTGIRARSLAAALAAEPASVQEKWFARLFVLKPLLITGLALFWIVTGLISLGPGWDGGVALLHYAGLVEPIATWTAVAGALADVAIGVGIAIRATARRALRAGLALSLVYLALATLLLPTLWSDPLGPLVKIIPIVLATLAALAIVDDR